MELTINSLKKENKKLKMKAMDLSKWQDWNSDDILIWIMSLDDGKYKRYHYKLQKTLKQQEITGDDLASMDATDVKDLGVSAFKDKKSLLLSIKKLVNKKKKNIKYNNVYE
eukprot:17363_1